MSYYKSQGSLKFLRIGLPIMLMAGFAPWIMSKFIQEKFDQHAHEHNNLTVVDERKYYKMPPSEMNLENELEKLNSNVNINNWKQVTLKRAENID